MEKLFRNLVSMKKLLILLSLFFISISSFSQTIHTINDGFWFDENTWVNGTIPTPNQNYDTIIVDHLVELDQDVTLYNCVLIVTNKGVICSNFYSLTIGNGGTVINNGYIAVKFIIIRVNSTFNNYGTVRTEEVDIQYSKNSPLGEYNDYNFTSIAPLNDACPAIEPFTPDSIEQVIKETIEIKEDTIEICEGKSPDFPYAKARYVWQNGAVNSDFKPKKSGKYTVEIVSNINSSRNLDSVFIYVIKSAESIPNIFTPNGDLINDDFLPSDFDLEELQLFNRWGKNILNSTSPINNYDELADGLYYFVITHNNKCLDKNPLKGWVQIMR